MKTVTALAALAIVGAGLAVAAGQPAAPTATPVRHPSLKVCNKQADAKQLTGEARSQYVKDCHAGKTAGKPATKSSEGSPGKSP
ncbi:MAG TPA: PsiF family protein [Steroidobacteraceae bacterium]